MLKKVGDLLVFTSEDPDKVLPREKIKLGPHLFFTAPYEDWDQPSVTIYLDVGEEFNIHNVELTLVFLVGEDETQETRLPFDELIDLSHLSENVLIPLKDIAGLTPEMQAPVLSELLIDLTEELTVNLVDATTSDGEITFILALAHHMCYQARSNVKDLAPYIGCNG